MPVLVTRSVFSLFSRCIWRILALSVRYCSLTIALGETRVRRLGSGLRITPREQDGSQVLLLCDCCCSVFATLWLDGWLSRLSRPPIISGRVVSSVACPSTNP